MMSFTEIYSDTSPSQPAYFKKEVDARIKELESDVEDGINLCKQLNNENSDLEARIKELESLLELDEHVLLESVTKLLNDRSDDMKWLEFKVEDDAGCPHDVDVYEGCPLCRIKELEKFAVDNFDWDNADDKARSIAHALHKKYYPENY
jgi:hypothetical protein